MNPTEAISLKQAPDFSGITLTQSATGHVHSPWFTFNWRSGIHGECVYDIGGRYHGIKDMAVAAFADVLKVNRHDVIVTERTFPGEFDPFWRLGTKGPCKIPGNIQSIKTSTTAKPEAIEI